MYKLKKNMCLFILYQNKLTFNIRLHSLSKFWFCLNHHNSPLSLAKIICILNE